MNQVRSDMHITLSQMRNSMDLNMYELIKHKIYREVNSKIWWPVRTQVEKSAVLLPQQYYK